MTAQQALNSIETSADDQARLQTVIEQCCDQVAPSWPLDRMIAVNPYWPRIQQPFAEVHHQLSSLAGSRLYMPLAYYRERWQRGEITESALRRAAAEQGLATTPNQAVQWLDHPESDRIPLPLLSDTLDRQRDLRHEPAWCDTITHQVSQFCAAYFDQDQADWRPDQQQALYQNWRGIMAHDRSVSLLMRAPQVRRRASGLADDPQQLIQQALAQLGVEPQHWLAFLQAVLLRINGWASWCAYRRWQARLADQDDASLLDLLAVRLAWECLLDTGERQPGSAWQQWQHAMAQHRSAPNRIAETTAALWQRAQEISYQDGLVQRLTTATEAPAESTDRPRAQAVFCIDVRSEVLRRHLESVAGDVATLGFAGFFGLPISYRPLGTAASRPQLPGLLASAFELSDSTGSSETDRTLQQAREQRLNRATGWKSLHAMPASAFAMVETLGLGYVGKLIKRSLPGGDVSAAAAPVKGEAALRPRFGELSGGGLEGQAELAANILAAMNLGELPGRLVLLVGHGSATRNNPHKAGLDCGACCGQTGEVNARALADLLNRAEVRERLAEQGKALPASTWFVAALHNTTTDEVTLFDRDEVPPTHRDDLAYIESRLQQAGALARHERSVALGAESLQADPQRLAEHVRQRASDWAQTRPEWGLANNAAFIIAGRERTRGVALDGRSFLHEYDAHSDPDGSKLEAIMTAPMIVTHWINMQYYASTVDPEHYGSGNKTLHNVVGGRIGVFEGNGGDLRIGLAKQSVHDGEQWRHEPLRLTVVIDAPRESIQAVLDKHAVVRDLVSNQWLYLARLDGDRVEWF